MLGGAGERFGGDVMGRGLSSSRRVIKLIRARVRDIATSRPFSYISEWAEVNNIEIAYTSANSSRLNQSLVTSQPSGAHSGIPGRSGGDGQLDVDRSAWRNCPTIGQEFARVVEDDDAVAQQAPPLLGVEGDGVGRVTVRTVG